MLLGWNLQSSRTRGLKVLGLAGRVEGGRSGSSVPVSTSIFTGSFNIVFNKFLKTKISWLKP